MLMKSLVAAVFIYTIGVPTVGLGQALSSSQVYLSIGVGDKISEAVPMFVFIKGRLSGLIPGIITLPTQDSAPVEIGIAQLSRSPLYSFDFAPEVLKTKKLNVVTTDIDPVSSFKANFFILHRDTVKTVELRTIHDNLYELRLPSTPYVAIEKIEGKNDKFEALPVKKAEDYGSSLHVIYDKNDGRSVSMGDSNRWSGTNTIAFANGGIGYIDQIQKWMIQSKPEGADIYTDTHPGHSVGKTNSTVEVTKSISSYALLKMDGYQQCVIQMDGYQQCTEKDCDKEEGNDGTVTFTCNLKKVQ